MEERILLAIHGYASETLDRVFVASHIAGDVGFGAALVTAAMLYCLAKGWRREALLWLGLGLTTFLLQAGLKGAFGRPRPELFVGPVPRPWSPAFPSGHALGAATLFPLFARLIAAHTPRWRTPLFGLAALAALWVGFGRLYLGVHWPTDVLAGWTLGLAQLTYALRRAGPLAPPLPGAAGDSSALQAELPTEDGTDAAS